MSGPRPGDPPAPVVAQPDASGAAEAPVRLGERLLLLCTRYVDHILFFMLQRLTERMRVLVLSSRENEWTELLRSRHAVRVLAPKSRFDGGYRAAIERMHAADPFSLVHCVHGNAELANLIQWSRGRVPVIGYRAYIGHLKFRENPSMYWSVRHPGMAAVVAVSLAVKRYLEGFRYLRPRNVRVINHGIDLGWMQSRLTETFGLRERLGIDARALVVVSMANLRPYKRFDLVVEAARRLAGRNVHFVHVGDDHGWRDRAEGIGNLHFLGHQSAPWPIVAEADVFATTAHNEAFGRSNLEALACGKPLIGSDTGGLLDLVEDGVNGRLFASGDAADFAEKVRYYEDNRGAVAQHGDNARASVKQRLSSDGMARRYLDLYAQVLAERTRRT